MTDEIINQPMQQPIAEKSVVETKPEECKPCRYNIGAAMMITVCKDIASKDPNWDMDCNSMEKELTEQEVKVAPRIVESIHKEVMEKGSTEDKEIVQELYDLSHGKE